MRQLVEWSHGCGRCAAVQHYNDLGLYYLHDIHGTYERCHEDYSGQYTLDPTSSGNVGAWRAVFLLSIDSTLRPRHASRVLTRCYGGYGRVLLGGCVRLCTTLDHIVCLLPHSATFLQRAC